MILHYNGIFNFLKKILSYGGTPVLDGEDVPCPLQAPLSFSYRRGGGRECLSPLSQAGGRSC